jgi:hypothetical protein
MKHITSQLQIPTGQCCLGKQSLVVVRTKRNTQIQCVGRVQSFNALNKMVHIVTAGFKWLKYRSTRRKRTPVPLCPPQIPHDLT